MILSLLSICIAFSLKVFAEQQGKKEKEELLTITSLYF